MGGPVFGHVAHKLSGNGACPSHSTKISAAMNICWMDQNKHSSVLFGTGKQTNKKFHKLEIDVVELLYVDLSWSFQQKSSCFRRAFNESHPAFVELLTGLFTIFFYRSNLIFWIVMGCGV